MPSTITVNIPEEIAKTLEDCAEGEQLTVSLTVSANDGQTITGDASDVQKGAGYDEEGAADQAAEPTGEPADEGMIPAKDHKEMVMAALNKNRY